ncbi:DUF4267 domain-containing protein [uncultured Fibrella sp.]|uniref:DUF4267 domain-containing protein n=1 Tax=uncultured Fibrella sp. TaxID=1284596 RepID=UPI0035CA299A
MTRQTPLTLLSLLPGLGLIFIGGRFLLAPEIAERGFGILVANQGDFAFHSIKGIRDLFTGLLITLLALTGQRKALAFCLLLGTLIPITDGWIVLSRPEVTTSAVLTHWLTAVFCAVTGTLLLVRRAPRLSAGPQPGYVHVLQSAKDGEAISVLEMSVSPGVGTPAHAHDQFAETFTVLAGELHVGVAGQSRVLRTGESATVAPGQTHSFKNQTSLVCHIQVRIEPGNAPFEEAMQIYYGLMRDGQATPSGTPKRLGDLALFMLLSNSNMVGVARLVQPVFGWLARRAARRGRLDALRSRYVPTVKSDSRQMGGVNVLLVAALVLLGSGTFAQSRFSKNEVIINAFRAPSIGLEYRHRAVSIHGGYYLTNLTPNVTTRFVKVGLTGWFLPVGQRENPSSFYASLSYLRGLNLDYELQNAASAEVGFRWMVWRGLNLRLGAIALAAEGKDLKINPTPGISYSFFFR